MCVRAEIHVVEQLPDRRLIFRLALQFEGKGDIVFYGEFVQNIIFLKNETDKSIAVGIEIALREILAGTSFYDHFAGGGRVEPAADVQ